MRNVFLFFMMFYQSFLFSNVPTVYSDKDYVRIAEHLKRQGQKDEAIKFYKKALNINSNNYDANIALAIEFYNPKEHDRSLKYLKKVHFLVPGNSSFLYHAGYVLYHQGRFEEAIEVCDKSVDLDTENKGAHHILSLCFLSLGELRLGYDHENKWYDICVRKGVRRKTDKPWEGQSNLVGKTVYLFDDLGMGDVFCFIRYAKFFKKSGAIVVVGVRQSLHKILSLCPYIDKIVHRIKETPYFDYQVYISHLPNKMYNFGDYFYNDFPYLYADEKLIEFWEKKLSNHTNLRVGICWDANVTYDVKTKKKNKSLRSMPLYYFYPISKLSKVSLYSLQQINGVEQLMYMPNGFKINTFNEKFDKESGSFMDTAAVMKNLDLVITVDTSIAHLAGALGVPVWVILPYVPDPRWLLDRSDTHLYPTMRLFRQKTLGDWESAMQDIYEALRNLVAS